MTNHRFRKATPADAEQMLRAAQEALATDTFYGTVLGFEPRDFDLYWRAWFRLVLADPHVDVFLVEDDGRVVALGALAHQGFPNPVLRDRFRAELSAELSPERWARLDAFLDAYDAIMALPAEEARREVQVLWVLITPGKRKMGYVGETFQTWNLEHRRPHTEVMTGFVNASAQRLIDMYLGYGARMSAPQAWGDVRLARISLELGPCPAREAAA